MSRFFATGDTSSESSSSESEDEVQQKPTRPTKKTGFAFSSEEEEEVRVVRSLKDKRFDEIKAHIKTIRNSKKIRDVSRAQEGFDNMKRIYDKSKTVVEAGGIPAFYVKALAELEDFVKELWDDKDVKAKLNKMNSKALSSLRQNLRKYIKDTPFEDRISAYRENPDEFEEEEDEEVVEQVPSEEESESESEDESATAKPTIPKAKPAPVVEGEESDDSIDWIASESESDSSDDELGPPGTVLHHTMFLKKKGVEGEEEKEKRKKEKKQKPRKDKGFEGVEDGEEWQKVERAKDPHRDLRKILFPTGNLDNLEPSDLLKKRGEVMALRGKKGTNAVELVEQMGYLLLLASEKKFSPAVTVKFKLDIVLTILDSAPNVDTALKEDMWKKLLNCMTDLLDCIEENTNVVLSGSISELEENLTDGSKPYLVYGSVLTIVERMDDEYIKLLQGTDSRSNDYVKSLSDEKVVTSLIERTQAIIVRATDANITVELCKIFMRRIEHLYFKLDRKYYSPSALVKLGSEALPPELVEQEDSSKLMAELTTAIYSSTVRDNVMNQIRTRAMLCHIYHHALHDRWFQARDLMLMSHLQENIQQADVETQILYNRAMAQLGMCAFRHGMIKDAHDALLDIQSSGRSKELLAQGLMANKDRTPEQEKLERRRLVPFHMHINLELMECVYLTSAMLLEIPYMALTESEGRRRMISKSFHHQLKVHEKQPLIGPPETMREHVVAASNAMREGDWKKCRDCIITIKAWDLFINVANVKEMLTRKIQEETLKTYIFSFGEVYNTLSLERLSVMFELPEATVHSIISKMIIKEELLASLDEPSRSVAIHHAKPSSLQSVTLHLSEKISSLADLNEELMKIKHATPWNTPGPMGNVHQRNQRSDNQASSRRRQGMARS